MDSTRERMYRRLTPRGALNLEFVAGVNKFIEFAYSQEDNISGNKIRCPCKKCQNRKYLPLDDVMLHLYKFGFVPNYYKWVCHGEWNRPSQPSKSHISSSGSTPNDPPHLITDTANSLLAQAPNPSFDPLHPVPAPNNQPLSASKPTRAGTICLQTKFGNDGREQVTLQGDLLFPSESCSRRITKIFMERVDAEGARWGTVSQETKDNYFEKFKKYFYWDEAMDSQVKAAWEKKCAQRYKDMVSRMKREGKKGGSISEEVWTRWQQLWSHPDWVLLSKQNSKNRRAGCSFYNGGSVSLAEHGRRLAAQLGREAPSSELHRYTHTRNHDGKGAKRKRGDVAEATICKALERPMAVVARKLKF